MERWIIASLCLVTVLQVGADVCSNYNYISEKHRSTQFVPGTADPLICDRALPADWYRFTNGDMPTSCVPAYHCGTQTPIWLDGRLPSPADGIVTRKVCFNYGSGVSPAIYGGSTCCHVSRQIRVRNCGTFNAYYLTRTSGCPMAYCAGNNTVCNYGQSAIGSPTCSALYPKMTQFPVLGNPYVDQNSAVQFPCHVPYPTGEQDVAFDVTWTADGQPINVPGTQTPVTTTLTGSSRDALLNGAFLRGHLQKTIKCNVVSYYTTSNGTRSGTRTSNGFWAGIRVSPSAVTVDEKGPDQVVTLESTVPIPCKDSHKQACTVTVEMKSKSDPNDVSTSTCIYDLKYDNVTHTYKASINVTATRDFVKDGDHLHELAFRPIADNPNNPMWGGYVVPPVQIKSKDRDGHHATCSATGDPHIHRIDTKHALGLYDTGDFTLYKSNARPFEVQIRNWVCGSMQPCVCAVIAREGNDVIQVDICPRSRGHIAAPELTVLSNNGRLEGTVIHRDRSGRVSYIDFPSGTRLQISAAVFKKHSEVDGYLNVNLQVPTDDIGQSEGICGKYDLSAANDLLGGNGVHYQKNHIHDFFQSWLVKPGSSMFDQTPSYNPAFAHHNTNYCQCDHGRADCTKTKAANPLAKNMAGHRSIGVHHQHVHHVHHHHHHHHRADYPRETHRHLNPVRITMRTSFPTASGMTEAMAIRSCTEAIRAASLFSRCRTVMSLTAHSFYIDACVKDMMISDSDIFNIAHMNTFDFECQDTVLRNISNYAVGTHGERIPPDDVTSHVCVNQCSRRGTCHQGTCACHSGYTAADCSVPAGVAPVISHIRGDGLCDVRDRECRKVQVIGQHLVDGPGLKCRYRHLQIDASGVRPNGWYIEVPASLTSFLEVECTLPASSVLSKASTVEAFAVSVTNDGTRYSSERTFVVYDGECQNCDVNGRCVLKNNTCLIDNRCRSSGDEDTNGRYCNPHNDTHGWSTSNVISEINHYTSTRTGCVCAYNESSYDCACCNNGGCQCGGIKPHICINCQHLASCSSYPDIIVDN